MPSTAPLPQVSTTLALKEWSAVVHGLLQGRQVLLLRKGGIHEKAFRLDGAGAFVVFPTVAHSHAERVRPEHRDLLNPGAADIDEVRGTFWVRAGLSLVAAVDVRRPDRLGEIEDLHIWTAASVQEDRVAFRPKHALQALVVRTFALPQPVELTRLDAYGGCTSWLDLPVDWDGQAGRQIVSDEQLRAVADRVRETVG